MTTIVDTMTAVDTRSSEPVSLSGSDYLDLVREARQLAAFRAFGTIGFEAYLSIVTAGQTFSLRRVEKNFSFDLT